MKCCREPRCSPRVRPIFRYLTEILPYHTKVFTGSLCSLQSICFMLHFRYVIVQKAAKSISKKSHCCRLASPRKQTLTWRHCVKAAFWGVILETDLLRGAGSCTPQRKNSNCNVVATDTSVTRQETLELRWPLRGVPHTKLGFCIPKSASK